MRIAATFLLCYMTISCFAQNEKLGIGFHGGLTLGFNKYYESSEYKVKPDYSAGISYRVSKKLFYLRNEILYSRRGVKITPVPSQETNIHLTYIDLNVLPGVQIKNFIFLGGLSTAINLTGEVIYEFEGQMVNGIKDSYTQDAPADPVDIGLILNVGYLIKINKITIPIDVRFSQYFMQGYFESFPSVAVTNNLRQISIMSGIIF